MKVLDYNIVTNLPELPLEHKGVINTINPHSYCIAKRDDEFKSALMTSDYLLPDGVGIVWACKMLEKEKINKIAGYDVFVHILNYLEKTKGSCFFLGASRETLALIKNRAKKEYPSITVGTFSPPFKKEFTEDDSLLMCKEVNKFNPDVLFLGMTAPKQEKWAKSQFKNLNVNITCCIGAVFDFYAGTVERPSEFWINLGLEWLPRFMKEPKRLAERNLISTPKFILEVMRKKFFSR